MFTQREKNVAQELKRHHSLSTTDSDEFALGNILVADGQITRAHLDNALLQQLTSGLRLGEELIKNGHASESQVESGLLLQRKLVKNAAVITMSLAAMLPIITPVAEAASTNAAMPVSVSVIARAKIQTGYQVSQLVIRKSDIARGYIEIPSAMQFSVSTNSHNGYLMQFDPVGNMFKSVEVSGLGTVITLGADGGTIVQRGVVQQSQTHALSFRFMLSPDITPGTFPWPLHLSVRPLA
jgi:hypothetical protein